MSEAFARPAAPMCVVLLTYTAELKAIDSAMPQHVAWLADAYANDLIIASGRRLPRIGGIIVMRGRKAEVERLVRTDPFVDEGLATAEIVPFTASMAHPALADLLA